jgi:hypothetical protein
MYKKVDDFIAVHEDPIWRNSADCILKFYLGEENGVHEWEQLWAKKTSSNSFILCCIPFFAFNISLGDEVEANDEFIINKLSKRSDQITFRVWLTDCDLDMRETFMNAIRDLKPLQEWSSKNLLALSIHNSDAQYLADCLQSLEEKGILNYETGRI